MWLQVKSFDLKYLLYMNIFIIILSQFIFCWNCIDICIIIIKNVICHIVLITSSVSILKDLLKLLCLCLSSAAVNVSMRCRPSALASFRSVSMTSASMRTAAVGVLGACTEHTGSHRTKKWLSKNCWRLTLRFVRLTIYVFTNQSYFTAHIVLEQLYRKSCCLHNNI